MRVASRLTTTVLAVLITATLLTATGCSAVTHSSSPHSSSPDQVAQSISSTSASATSSAQSTSGARTVTVLGSGDVLIHQQLWQQAAADAQAEGKSGYDFAPLFASVAPVTRAADLATCELEGPLALPTGPFVGWPTFSMPPQVLTALVGVGYDSCTTASNHTLDDGTAGITRTLDELDAAGLKHTGSARSALEAATPLIFTEPNGVKIAQLAYAFGFNGNTLPAGQSWWANLTDVPTILAAAHRAKQAGADIVVLSMHWGVEYNTGVTALQQQQAQQLLASPDIDLILGDHPHVVEPFAKIGAKWVVYSMGNQVARHEDPVTPSREGVMPEFTFTETSPGHFQITKAQALTTWMQFDPYRLIDVASGLADPSTPAALRAQLVQARSDLTGYLNGMGAVADGLQIS